MAYTAPMTFSPGLVVTDTHLNQHIRDNFLAIAGTTGYVAWATWVPATTQGGTTPNGTNVYSTWSLVGKMADVTVNVAYTQAGSTANDIVISTLPVAPRYTSAYAVLGTFLYVATGVFYEGVVVTTNSTSNVKMICDGATGFLGNTGGPVFAIASGHQLSMTLRYEGA